MDLNEDQDMEDAEGSHSDDADEDEDDYEEEEGEDNEFIDLLDVLDGKGELETGSDADDRAKHPINDERKFSEDGDDGKEGDDEEVGGRVDNDDDDGYEEDSVESDDGKLVSTPSDMEDAAPEALDELQTFISTLSPTAKKRKALEVNAPDRSRKQRRLSLKERTEAGAENEFRAQNSGTSFTFTGYLLPSF